MKIAILLKSGPHTDNADRALQTASDILAQGHKVSLFLLQEAVRFCIPSMKRSDSLDLKQLGEKNLEIHAMDQDAKLRGINPAAFGQQVLEGSYDSLIDLLDSSDQVIGIL
jgi:sulfur relay (sulfurtransferase) complex TusBCD TusD component (DsrE family)